MTVEPLIEETIETTAAPVRVWSLVSDLANMSRWSPQVARTIVRGRPVQLGTKAININRDGVKVWPTQSKVVRFEPHREIAFRIKENRSIWSFQLEQTETGGTRITQRRETPDGTTKISETLVDKVLGGQDSFQGGLRRGMRETLQKIKVEAER